MTWKPGQFIRNIIKPSSSEEEPELNDEDINYFEYYGNSKHLMVFKVEGSYVEYFDVTKVKMGRLVITDTQFEGDVVKVTLPESVTRFEIVNGRHFKFAEFE